MSEKGEKCPVNPKCVHWHKGCFYYTECNNELQTLAQKATERIKQLQAENKRLREALQKIVDGRFHFKDHGMMDFHKIAEQALQKDK